MKNCGKSSSQCLAIHLTMSNQSRIESHKLIAQSRLTSFLISRFRRTAAISCNARRQAAMKGDSQFCCFWAHVIKLTPSPLLQKK
jgi:hypothetical protein